MAVSDNCLTIWDVYCKKYLKLFFYKFLRESYPKNMILYLFFKNIQKKYFIILNEDTSQNPISWKSFLKNEPVELEPADIYKPNRTDPAISCSYEYFY